MYISTIEQTADKCRNNGKYLQQTVNGRSVCGMTPLKGASGMGCMYCQLAKSIFFASEPTPRNNGMQKVGGDFGLYITCER